VQRSNCTGHGVALSQLADINSEFNFLNANLFGIGRACVYRRRKYLGQRKALYFGELGHAAGVACNVKASVLGGSDAAPSPATPVASGPPFYLPRAVVTQGTGDGEASRCEFLTNSPRSYGSFTSVGATGFAGSTLTNDQGRHFAF
jgi:hypothetical protein